MGVDAETIETVETPISTIVETPEIIETPAPAPAPEEPEVPEQSYTYQPTDEKGRPLGGKQVIKYKTVDELTQKLTEQNIHLVRKLREESRKVKMGVIETDEIPDTAPRFTQAVEFKPRQLSPDERFQLSRDLLDPEKFEEATNTLLEARLGGKPEDVTSAMNKIAQDNMKIMAKVESDAFLANNPDYFPCRENFDTLTGYMVTRNLEPTRENFQFAYEKLKRSGENGASLFVGKPEEVQNIVTPPTPIEEPVVESTPVRQEVPVKKVAPPPTGLTNTQTGEVTGTPVKKYKLTLKDINNMPSEEYKKRLISEKGFAEMVDELEKEAAQSKRNR